MKSCKWEVEGKIRTTPTITRKGRRSYATVHLEIEGGEIVAFAHDETIVKELVYLTPQNLVRLTGIIEPRNPELASTKPYFLNVLYIEHL
jgi:hypothetical protein